MKRVLVTGGSGFIGSYCLPRLVALGYEVHVAGRRPFECLSGVTSHRVDVLDARQVADTLAMVRPTHVLHLAWNVEPGYWTSSENRRWVHASIDLLEAFKTCGGERAVFVGTCAEYGDDPGVCTEDRTPLRPTTQYGRAKLEVGACVASASEGSNSLSTAWARIFYLYGPGERMERIVPSTIRALTNNETMVCRSPDEVRDYLFVEDVADALANLLDSDVGGPVNIGSGNGVSNRKLMLEIADQLQRKELVRFASAAGSTVVADIRRLNNEVGWKPHINLAEGIARSIARVRESIGVS